MRILSDTSMFRTGTSLSKSENETVVKKNNQKVV